MKIAIPMEEKSINSSICVTFGRAPYFLIFDTDTGEETYMENPAAAAQEEPVSKRHRLSLTQAWKQ